MSDGQLKAYYVYSPWLRIFHWLMVMSIVVLFFTGLYIGNPFFIGSQGLEPTYAFSERLSMETVRFIHFAAAFILVCAFVLRVYGFVVNKGDRLLPRFWTKQHWAWTMDIMLHYMLLRASHKPYLRNPLARMSYLGVYFLIGIEAITGFTMYVMVDPKSIWGQSFSLVNSLLINEYYVHLIHHYVAWLIIIFAVVHIYMAVRADFMEREGEISSMFSGVKFLAHQPVDLGEIATEEDSLVRYWDNIARDSRPHSG
ncbi:MAG: hyaC [Firmicutes bacterium]|nr:hyaC [Bacillota bacterium]